MACKTAYSNTRERATGQIALSGLTQSVTRSRSPSRAWALVPSRAWALAAVFLLAGSGVLGLGGCRTSIARSNGTAVGSGDSLTGRMVAGRREQAFTFEGVESSLVDFTVQADTGNQPAPRIEVLDPEGRVLDVAGSMRTGRGSATAKVQSLVLPRTGTYKVIVRPSSACETVFYRFSHCLRFAPIRDRRAHLTPDTPRPVYVSAPRGGLIVVTIDPLGGDLEPAILGVKDPWGGPALDRSVVPAGALPPRVSHMQNRTMILTFTAPRPGMYTILAASKPCKPGVGLIHVEVRQPRGCAKAVYHDNSNPGGFGVPGELPQARPTSACPPVRPEVCAPACPPPPPPPAVCPPTAVARPVTSADPALATR